MSLWSLLLAFGLHFYVAVCSNLISRTDSNFVTVQNCQFEFNGKPFGFYGTNAYWLNMATDDDIEITLHDIAAIGMNVVRVWAFNDVPQKPSTGVYYQILQNGTATINTGPDGLQRLDQVVATAKKFGLKLILTFTNNWNPPKPDPGTAFSRRDNSALPRGYLSNDYGGIDAYVRAFTSGGTHDEFYTNTNIINAFKNYISQVINRYTNDPTILAWEIGNDLRCSSTIPASSSCNPTTITTWAADIAQYIKKCDSNHHLVTPGDGGFYCLGCPKTFANTSTPKNANSPTGPTFDGSFGIDTEDLISIPNVDFGSFQLFPDQIQYFPPPANVEAATVSIIQGQKWISMHSATATLFCKPDTLTAFTIVTEDNWAFFVPFDQTTRRPQGSPCGGARQTQLDYAYSSWASVALGGNYGGALEYQWLQRGLTSQGTTFARRQLSNSPNDGSGNYQTPYTNQSIQDVLGSFH